MCGKMKKLYLITGATGHVGTVLVSELRLMSWKVISRRKTPLSLSLTEMGITALL